MAEEQQLHGKFEDGDDNELKFRFDGEFRSSYQRNNKKGGKKHLRCFPCCGPNHKNTNACEVSLRVEFEKKVESNFIPNKEDVRYVAFGRFLPLLKDGKGIALDDISDKLGDIELNSEISSTALYENERTSDNPFLPLYRGKLLDSSEKNALFQFREKAWHYGWKGGRYKQSMCHVLRIYVFEGPSKCVRHGKITPVDPPVNLKCIARISSPPFTIFSSRSTTMPAKSNNNTVTAAKKIVFEPVKEGAIKMEQGQPTLEIENEMIHAMVGTDNNNSNGTDSWLKSEPPASPASHNANNHVLYHEQPIGEYSNQDMDVYTNNNQNNYPNNTNEEELGNNFVEEQQRHFIPQFTMGEEEAAAEEEARNILLNNKKRSRERPHDHIYHHQQEQLMMQQQQQQLHHHNHQHHHQQQQQQPMNYDSNYQYYQQQQQQVQNPIIQNLSHYNNYDYSTASPIDSMGSPDSEDTNEFRSHTSEQQIIGSHNDFDDGFGMFDFEGERRPSQDRSNENGGNFIDLFSNEQEQGEELHQANKRRHLGGHSDRSLATLNSEDLRIKGSSSRSINSLTIPEVHSNENHLIAREEAYSFHTDDIHFTTDQQRLFEPTVPLFKSKKQAQQEEEEEEVDDGKKIVRVEELQRIKQERESQERLMKPPSAPKQKVVNDDEDENNDHQQSSQREDEILEQPSVHVTSSLQHSTNSNNDDDDDGNNNNRIVMAIPLDGQHDSNNHVGCKEFVKPYIRKYPCVLLVLFTGFVLIGLLIGRSSINIPPPPLDLPKECVQFMNDPGMNFGDASPPPRVLLLQHDDDRRILLKQPGSRFGNQNDGKPDQNNSIQNRCSPLIKDYYRVYRDTHWAKKRRQRLGNAMIAIGVVFISATTAFVMQIRMYSRYRRQNHDNSASERLISNHQIELSDIAV